MSKVGLKFGQLTIIEELPTAFRCRCDCGRITLTNKSITKPSYKKRLRCEVCAGRPCEECGTWINATAGMQALTCSEKCRRLRANRKEAERYERVKNTDAWRAVRAAYLGRLAEQRANDPLFDSIFRAYRADALRKYRQTDKGQATILRAYKAWYRRLRDDQAAWAGRLREMNRWYHGLTDAERERIFYEPRRARMAAAPHPDDQAKGVEDF